MNLIDVLLHYAILIGIMSYGIAFIASKAFGGNYVNKLTAFYMRSGRKFLTWVFQKLLKAVHFCFSSIWRWLWT